ncbi:DUF2378 family protein [Hyalangium gracile]|uniref:DUF2378 family protein n=1 Tax=Hyalangium gracile TaxID=394092 RepID=UPI001CC997BB|nr:DUF2378 family protein [Hyalangium gracile]
MTGLAQEVVEVDLGSEGLLERHLVLARPEDAVRGMFFNGVLGAVGQLMGEEVARHCRQATGERKHVDFFTYPVASFLRLCLSASGHVGPRLGGCERMLRWLGEQAARDFLGSMAGKTALLLAEGNPKRLLSQLPSSYRAAVSYGERSVMWVGGSRGRVLMRRDFMPPAYHEGVLRGTLLVAGARGVHVQGRPLGLLDSEYEISWE